MAERCPASGRSIWKNEVLPWNSYNSRDRRSARKREFGCGYHIYDPQLSGYLEIWNQSPLQVTQLKVLGVYIAQINIKRQINKRILILV